MNRKQIIIVAGIVVLALALVGMGYGLWFEQLRVEGTVETGELNVDFSPVYTFEWFGDGQGNVVASQEIPLDWPAYAMSQLPLQEAIAAGLFEIKHDYVECYADLSNTELESVPNADAGDNLLTISVVNAYPSYHCRVIFDITNVGDVPIHLTDWWYVPVDGQRAEWVEPPTCVPGELVDGHTGFFPGTEIIQLHQGETAVCHVDLHFTNDTGYAGERSKGAAIRFKDFIAGGDGDIYLGAGDIGVGGNRSEAAGVAWATGVEYPFSFVFDGAKLNGSIAGKDLEYTNLATGCEPGEYMMAEMLVRAADGGTVTVSDLTFDGWNAGTFVVSGGTEIFEFWPPDVTLGDGFNITGTMLLEGTMAKGEHNKVDIQTFCVQGIPVQENTAYNFAFMLQAEQWNESGAAVPAP